MTGFTLSVWRFDTPDGAHRAVRTLEDMQGDGLLSILDYATVSWEAEDTKPVGKQGSPSVSTARLGGAFWGMLFGLTFFVPMLGAAMRSARGALAGSMAGVGIDDGFIKKLRTEVTPGTSALFLMSPGAVVEPVKGRIGTQTPSELISTGLSQEQDLALRRVFGGDSGMPRLSGTAGSPTSTRSKEQPTVSFTVWHFSHALGASAGEVRLQNLEARGALTVLDAICLSWMPGTPGPRLAHPRSGTQGGTALSRLAGTLAVASPPGTAAGAGLGALAARLRHTGIDRAFLEEIASRLVPGTSALLVLSEDADLDAMGHVLERGRSRGAVTMMHAVLRDEAAHSLRDLVGSAASYPSGSSPAQDVEPVGSSVPSQRSASSGPSRRREETP